MAFPVLDQLEIREIYEFYDMPILFLSKSSSGEMFLAYWFDETEFATGWLYLPILEKELKMLKQKELSIRGAFTNTEDCFLVYRRTPPKKGTIERVPTSQLNPDDLPAEGYYIEHVEEV